MNTTTHITTSTTDTDTPSTRHRSRWAAIGAAVAVSLGAGTVGYVGAAGPSASAYVPLTSCRAIDTRPVGPIGPRSSPLGNRDVLTVPVGAGVGQCAALPADAVAVSLNVTALGATMPTHLTIWPSDESMPNASSLNPAPNQPPTPNAVTTPLSTGGSFDVFNFQGSVNVIVDVTGYYTEIPAGDAGSFDTALDARLGEIDQMIDAFTAAFESVYEELDEKADLDEVAFAPDGEVVLPALTFRADASSAWEIGPYLHHTTATSQQCIAAPVDVPNVDGPVVITDFAVYYEAASTTLVNTTFTAVYSGSGSPAASYTDVSQAGKYLPGSAGVVKRAVISTFGVDHAAITPRHSAMFQLCAAGPITITAVTYRVGHLPDTP